MSNIARKRAALAQDLEQPETGAAGMQAWQVAPMPSIADLRDQDWRDTGLSWANFAGCTKGEIGSLSGHAFTGREAVLRHYVANDVALAASAVAKVAQWFDDQVSRMEEATG
jgi:hypothetical protein